MPRRGESLALALTAQDLLVIGVSTSTNTDLLLRRILKPMRKPGICFGYATYCFLEEEFVVIHVIGQSADGVLVPGGFGDRGVPGKIAAAGWESLSTDTEKQSESVLPCLSGYW